MPFQKGHKTFNTGRTWFKKGGVSLNKGKHLSKVTISKIREARLIQKDPRLGKKHTLETRLKIGISRKGKNTGENHPNWIKDRSKLVKQEERRGTRYKEWSLSVKNRDGWKCKIFNGDCVEKIVAHHILPWSKFQELRYKIKNGITLCRFHHPLKRVDEIKLSPFFYSLITT